MSFRESRWLLLSERSVRKKCRHFEVLIYESQQNRRMAFSKELGTLLRLLLWLLEGTGTTVGRCWLLATRVVHIGGTHLLFTSIAATPWNPILQVTLPLPACKSICARTVRESERLPSCANKQVQLSPLCVHRDNHMNNHVLSWTDIELPLPSQTMCRTCCFFVNKQNSNNYLDFLCALITVFPLFRKLLGVSTTSANWEMTSTSFNQF